MRRLFTLMFAAMLAGQAWAATTFTNGYFRYTVTDAENHYVSVNKSSVFLPDSLVIPATVVNGGVTY